MAVDESSVIEGVNGKLLIDGEWRDSSNGETFAVEDPSTGETLCEIADGTPDDAKAALDAACAAQEEWGTSAANDRSELLHDVFKLLGERIEELATLMTLEMGKSVAESK